MAHILGSPPFCRKLPVLLFSVPRALPLAPQPALTRALRPDCGDHQAHDHDGYQGDGCLSPGAGRTRRRAWQRPDEISLPGEIMFQFLIVNRDGRSAVAVFLFQDHRIDVEQGANRTRRVGAGYDVAKAIGDVKRGKVEFKMDKLASIHFVIGKRSFKKEQLVENGTAAIEAIVRSRPPSIKGLMIKRISLSSTMSPGIPLRTEGLERDFSSEN